MGFDVEVAARADGPLRVMLDDLVGPSCVRPTCDGVVLTVVDQAALVGVLGQLHDLGLLIEQVRRAD